MDCWNEINETRDSKGRNAFSRDKGLREDAAGIKQQSPGLLQIGGFRFLFLAFIRMTGLDLHFLPGGKKIIVLPP